MQRQHPSGISEWESLVLPLKQFFFSKYKMNDNANILDFYNGVTHYYIYEYPLVRLCLVIRNGFWVRVVVFNATFNKISVISWQSVSWVEETFRKLLFGPHIYQYQMWPCCYLYPFLSLQVLNWFSLPDIDDFFSEVTIFRHPKMKVNIPKYIQSHY